MIFSVVRCFRVMLLLKYQVPLGECVTGTLGHVVSLLLSVHSLVN